MKLIYLFILFTLVGTGLSGADECVLSRPALVKVATACMRANPRHSAELVSQAVMGTPVKLLAKEGSWWHVETPEGYRGYIIGNSLQPLDSAAMHAWRKSSRVMYTMPYTGRVMSHTGPVSDVHSGSVLETVPRLSTADSVGVKLPDGRRGRLSRKDTIPLDSLSHGEVDTRALLAMARALMGVSYLWGGTTTAGMDCSGLTKICYQQQGIILQRDASQQALTGRQLGTDYRQYRQGDLVFFKSATTGNIVHVGIYDHDGLYVHSSGRVRVNSLDPSSPLYIPSNLLAGATRIAGHLNTPGITTITTSHAYFNNPE